MVENEILCVMGSGDGSGGKGRGVEAVQADLYWWRKRRLGKYNSGGCLSQLWAFATFCLVQSPMLNLIIAI